MATQDYLEYLGVNAAERVLTQALFSGILPVLIWLLPDHSYSLFLQGRLLDGLASVALYGATFLGLMPYYHAEWKSVSTRTLRRRLLLRGAVFLGSLAVIVFLLPFGPAIRLSQTASEDNVIVFLSSSDLEPGKTVGAMLRVNLPNPVVCDITHVELVWDGRDPGSTVFGQPAFHRDSEGNFFGPVFYGGCPAASVFRFPVVSIRRQPGFGSPTGKRPSGACRG